MNTEELRIYLRTVADTTGVQQTQQALRTTQTQAASIGRTSGAGLVAFSAAAFGAVTAGNAFVDFLTSSIQTQREHERVARATAAAYGAMAGQWQRFASELSAQTGFTSDAILEAALSARTLSQNYKLTTQQTQELIKVSADLARVRGIGIAESFERVQSAIRGEAEAAEYLGLTLNDTFVKNNALNGSVRNTFETMTDAQKAQVRYTELLRQSAQFAGLAASQTKSLDAAFASAAKSGRDFQLMLGEMAKPAAIAGLTGIADLVNDTAIKMREIAEMWAWINRLELPGIAALEGPSRRNVDARKAEEARLDQSAARRDARLRALNEDLPRRSAAEDLARLALWDQVDAAVRDASQAQQRQVELQRESVDLAAQEAQLRLSMLPAMRDMAEAQRQMTEQQIRARQAALPAAEALEDLRFAQQRAQLIAQNRNVGVEERIAARRELRGIGRALPGAELAALESGRGVTLAGRAAERLGMEAQLFQISTQRALEQVEQQQQTNTLLSQIAAQQTQAIELTINLGTEEFQTEVFKQLIEAEKQAQGPTTIKLSGVRR